MYVYVEWATHNVCTFEENYRFEFIFFKISYIRYICNYSTLNFCKCYCLSRNSFLHLGRSDFLSNLSFLLYGQHCKLRNPHSNYNTHAISTVYVSSSNDFSTVLNFFCTFPTGLKAQISSTSS